MPTFRSLDDADVTGKRVLVRVDLNVPMQDGKVADSTRIEEVVPTLTELADKGGKIVLLSHFDRPKGRDPNFSLRPVAAEVARLVKRPVGFADDCIGPKAEAAVAALKNGDIACLENTRFHPGEEKNDKEFAKKLAALGDIFVNDAFSASHREHASTTSIVTVSGLPAYPGRAMKSELDALARAFERPKHPVTAIVGGAKANTFLVAQGRRVGKSLFESDLVGAAAEIMSRAQALGREIVLPVDAVVARQLATHAPSHVVSVEHVVSALARSKTLVWNGPFGAFEHEPFDNGTIEVAEAAAELTSAGKLVSLAGGGDTVAALNAASAKERMTHVSTGGGAFLESLEGKTLPGVRVLLIPQQTKPTGR